MPTDLPIRAQVQDRIDIQQTRKALLIFYGVSVLVVLLLISAEALFGMFDGLTVAEALLRETGSEFPIDGTTHFGHRPRHYSNMALGSNVRPTLLTRADELIE